MAVKASLGHDATKIELGCVEVGAWDLCPIALGVVPCDDVVDVGAYDAAPYGVDVVAVLHGLNPCVKVVIRCSVCLGKGLEGISGH